jgi:hypothetical protein
MRGVFLSNPLVVTVVLIVGALALSFVLAYEPPTIDPKTGYNNATGTFDWPAGVDPHSQEPSHVEALSDEECDE